VFSNKTLIITGGTGSFGNAVLRRFLHTDIKEIRVFSRDEKKQDEMRNVLQNPKLKFYLGNVRDYDSILPDLQDVEMMLCATAFKQVTQCEFFSI
jgi:UDP-glucose 4-epimerase